MTADPSRWANAPQAQRWNGPAGSHWIAHRERHAAEHQRLVPHLYAAAGIGPGEQVLDVGCGCGPTTITAARAASGGGGSALGVDLSAPMLDVARQLAADAGVTNARFIQGDVQTFPLRRDHYDVVISSFGVMFYADPAAAFANITAALRPSGRLAFLCWQEGERNEMLAIPLRELAAHMPLPPPQADPLFHDPRQITGLLSGAGCTDVTVTDVTEQTRLGRDVAEVMSYQSGRPSLTSLLAQLPDPALADQVLAAITRQYNARQRPDGVWVTAAAWLVTAHRA